jgi:transcriptional regulator with XRE-family HTH domain
VFVGWSQAELAAAAGVSDMTVKRFESERETATGTVSSLQRIKTALEEAGIIFIDADDRHGPGVRLADRG